jgi:prepilin signal peptidase PulO-like enzyme (type II secretory pathway)
MIENMEHFFICATLGLFGLILGSYGAATVWRLRGRQLVEDKAAGEPVDKQEYARLLPLTKETTKTDRSRCLDCGHQLAWYDLLPLASWLSLRGKCRYCHKKIGWFEPLMEFGVATFFILSYLLWPHAFTSSVQVFELLLWLISGVMLAILFAYDSKWFILPNRLVFPLMGIGAMLAVLRVVTSGDVIASLLTLMGAVVILSGLYLVLWLLSKGQWIGFGDVKLGLALALLLGDWQLAFIALFAANLIGCLIVIPGMLAKKITRMTRIPFGPLLILGTVIAMLAGPAILSAYFTFSTWYSTLFI